MKHYNRTFGLSCLYDESVFNRSSDNIAEEAHRVTAGDQAAIVTLIDRSRSSFLIRPTSTCSSLRGSLLDPSPPYALSLHGDFADAARLYTSEIDANVITPLPDTSEDESISPAVADPGQSEVLESRTDRATTDRDASSGAVADEQSLAVILEASSEPVTEISAADSARSGLQNFSFPSWSRYIPSTTSTAEGFLRDPIIDPTHIASKSAFSPIARGNHIPGSRDGDDRSCSEIVFTLSDDHGPGDFPDSDVLISQPPGAHTYLIADQQEHPVNADGINQSPVPNSVKEKQKEERSDLSTPVHKPRFETRSVKPCPKTQVHRQHKIAIIGGPASNKDELINRFLQRGPHDKLQENHNFKDCVVDGNTATIEIMASPGLEHYSAMHDTFLGAGQGYLLVYSPASRQSFEEIRSLYVRIERLKFEISETYNRQPYPAYTPPPSQYEVGSRWPRVLVSNGGHSKNLRQVSHHEELEMARSLDCPLIKVSEQHYWTVEKAFYDLIRDICEQHFTPKIPTPVVLDKVEPVESRKPARPFWHRRSWKG